jgi:intracellular sulfur oxidation DsrE/DsrF family protein
MITRRHLMAASAALPLLAEAQAQAAEAAANAEVFAADELQFPRIAGYGGVFSIDGIAEPPLPGTKVLFDLTTEAKPGELNKGLEVVARFLNLAAAAGVPNGAVTVEVVIHGPTVISSLTQAAYAAKTATDAVNPNEKLVKALAAAGVPLWICSQAVRRQKFALSDILPAIKPATSAMAVSITRQQAGWAVLLPH